MSEKKNLKVLYGYSYTYYTPLFECIVYNVFQTEEERDYYRHSHIDDTMIFKAYLLEEFDGKKEVICLDYGKCKCPFKRYFWYDSNEGKTYKFSNVKKEWKEHKDEFLVSRFKALYEE